MHKIVTHSSPDLDAIVSVWLLRRYLLRDSDIIFLTKTSNPSLLERAVAVTDMGRVYDPQTYRFDHKPLKLHPGRSATSMVYDFLSIEYNLNYLADLVQLVTDGDLRHATPAVTWSRKLGPHRLVQQLRLSRQDDYTVYRTTAALLETQWTNQS